MNLGKLAGCLIYSIFGIITDFRNAMISNLAFTLLIFKSLGGFHVQFNRLSNDMHGWLKFWIITYFRFIKT